MVVEGGGMGEDDLFPLAQTQIENCDLLEKGTERDTQHKTKQNKTKRKEVEGKGKRRIQIRIDPISLSSEKKKS